MIRMRIFMVDTILFGSASADEYLKSKGEKGLTNYNNKMKMREKEVEPIENFIAEIGFQNVRSIINSTSSPGYFAYTIFYEDNGQGRI